LIGKRVLLLYHEDQPKYVEVRCEDKSYGLLAALDVHVNARVKRNRDRGTELDVDDKQSKKYQGGKLWAAAKEDA
jgi:hypothetical protein